MLKEVSGDITLSGAQAIIQGVAPEDHFNQGLALSLRELYPAMSKDFRHYCKISHPGAGEIWAWGGVDKKGHPGKATTANVNSALRALRKLVEEENFTSIALPKLATGVGGLDWEGDILPLIERHLGDLDIPVYLYTTFKKGEKAAE